MRRVLRYIFSLTIILGLAPNVSVNNASAAGGFHLAISPVTVFLDLESGSELTREFKIENSSDDTTDYKVYAAAYSMTDETGDKTLNEDTIYTKLKDWITFYDGENFSKTLSGTLEAHSAVTITYKISVPSDPPATGQYASIFAETVNNSASGSGASIKANVRIGLNLIAKTNVAERREAEIIANSIPSFLLNGNVSASFGVSNSGNVHVDAFQKLTVENLFGELLYGYDGELEGGKIVMPEKTIYSETSWGDSPSVGIYRVSSIVSIPSLDLISTESKIVVAIPPILLATILILLIAIVSLLVILIIRRRKMRKMRKAVR